MVLYSVGWPNIEQIFGQLMLQIQPNSFRTVVKVIKTEKNASHWSKNKFSELFVGAKIETDYGKCEITEITKCEGDAVVNNRKAKLIFFYEWEIEMKWKGTLVNGDNEAKGTIQIPNLSEEHEIKDVDVNIYLDATNPEAEVLKEMMRSTGIDIVRQKMSDYLINLKEEFSKGLILPTKDSGNPEVMNTEKLNKKNDILTHKPIKSSNQTVNFEIAELKTTESFKCTAEEFYRSMTAKELVQAFTQGNCVLDPVEGGKFELFDGNVQGHFVKLEPNRTIVQKWRFKTWPEGHYSDVTMSIDQKMDCTEVRVLQSGIPKTELENTSEGWKRFYWDSMKRTFGFGAMLF